MEIVNRVRYAEGLVADLESLPVESWERLRGRRKFRPYMAEYLSAKCVTDLWYHLRFGIYFRGMKHYWEPLHGPAGVSGYLQDWTMADGHGGRRKVGLKFLVMARELCKTQLGSIGWASWMFARDRNWRCLLRGWTDSKAWQISGALKDVMESASYQARYPWVRPAAKQGGQYRKWTPAEFWLERDELGVRVPSLEACGYGSDPTGGHFQGLIYDDFELKESANSATYRPLMFETFQNDRALVTAGGKTLFIGTPWARDGIIRHACEHLGIFEEMEYDVFRCPVTLKVFEAPFVGEACTLDGDRMTVRVGPGTFPTVEADVATCQAKVRFFSPATEEYVEEIREVEENGGDWFRVNRPFPALLGAPCGWVVGNEKPAAPNRTTLDSEDWSPPEHLEAEVVARKSTVMEEKEMGSLVYSAQKKLEPVDEASLLLNPRHIKVIAEKDLPEGPRYYYRACDMATGGKTKAATAITEGFWHADGLFVTWMAYKNQMDAIEKLWLLMTRHVVMERAGTPLKFTTLEKAHVEKTLQEFLPVVQRDPHAFFSKAGERFAGQVDEYFEPGREVRMRLRVLSRAGQDKCLRTVNQQVLWESGRLYVVEGCDHLETLQEHARAFRLTSTECLDLLETIEDLRAEGRAPVVKAAEAKPVDEYQQRLREMAERNRLKVQGGGHRGMVGV